MATTKPRITISLTPRQHEVLSTMSKHSGKPMSSTISELVEASLPVFERMALAFQRIDGVHTAHRQKMTKVLGAGQSKMENLLSGLIGQFDMFVTDVEDVAAEVGGATAGASTSKQRKPQKTTAAPKTPGVVTRGSTSGRNPHPAVKPLHKRTGNKP